MFLIKQNRNIIEGYWWQVEGGVTSGLNYLQSFLSDPPRRMDWLVLCLLSLPSPLLPLHPSLSQPGRKAEPKLQSEGCDYCSLGYSNTYCSYRSANC